MDGAAELTCPRHGISTRLSCVQCQTAICPMCAVRTEVGLTCPDDAKQARPPPARTGRFWATVAVVLLWAGGGAWLLARRIGVAEPAGPRCPTQPAPDVGIGEGRGGPHWREMARSPLCGRFDASVVWTGRELLVWGGQSCAGRGCPSRTAPRLADGAAYVAASDSWRPLAPSPLGARAGAATVWTGREMIVWGGGARGQALGDGAAYDPAGNRWRSLPPSPLEPRVRAASVWTGREMIVWGGDAFDDGAAYDPQANRWRALPFGPLDARYGAVAAWTGREMVVWGGIQADEELPYDDGAAYDPAADTWRRMAQPPVGGREYPASVWTGEELVVWGGDVPFSGALGDGAAYNPSTDRWRTLAGSPLSARTGAFAAFDGKELLLWGGLALAPVEEGGDPSAGGLAAAALGDGAAYDPVADSWRTLESVTLIGRGFGMGAWDGRRMLLWGGLVAVAGAASAADGAAYTP